VVAGKKPYPAITVGKAVLWTMGLGVVAGIGYATLRKKKRRR
jgi:hypothetical protein